jgi:hypothetical protein
MKGYEGWGGVRGRVRSGIKHLAEPHKTEWIRHKK